jgi:protein Mpv17
MHLLTLVKRQGNAMNAFARKRPLLTSAGITSFKAWAADLMIQKLVERRETIDKRRSLLFASFGLLYQGGFQYWMYNVLFERFLFPGKSARMIFAKVAVTNLICDPCFFFPTFYCFREALASENLGDLDPSEFVPAALAKYKGNYWPDWVNSWLIWVPAHCITYGVCPPHLRMPWIAAVSFGYVSLLSFTRGEHDR